MFHGNEHCIVLQCSAEKERTEKTLHADKQMASGDKHVKIVSGNEQTRYSANGQEGSLTPHYWRSRLIYTVCGASVLYTTKYYVKI